MTSKGGPEASAQGCFGSGRVKSGSEMTGQVHAPDASHRLTSFDMTLRKCCTCKLVHFHICAEDL